MTSGKKTVKVMPFGPKNTLAFYTAMMQSFRDNLNILFNEHDTISNFLNHQRILFVMITSSSMTFFYFLTTSQLFYINFSALRKFLQNIFFPLNLANATSSMIESNMLDMI